MKPMALKWAWRHGVLNVQHFQTLDQALYSAEHQADDGNEALASIEVWDDEGHRVLTPDECWALNDAREQQANVSRGPVIPPTTTLVLIAPDGTECVYGTYVDSTKAGEDAADFIASLGPERVVVRPWRGLRDE